MIRVDHVGVPASSRLDAAGSLASLFSLVAYGSHPNDPTNGRIDHPLSEHGLFFHMPDGHLFELMASNSGEA
jgi:hypothetical protein